MRKIILTLTAFTIGLSAHAAGWAELLSSPYSQNTTYSVPQTNSFSVIQPANPQYNNEFYQDPNQVQCQAPYVNPYLYRNPYGYVNPYTPRINPLLPSATSTNSSIIKNIGQSLLYSMMRGY